MRWHNTTSWLVPLFCLLILCGCAPKDKAWIDVKAISDKVVREEGQTTALEVAAAEEAQEARKGPRIQDISEKNGGGNPHLQKVRRPKQKSFGKKGENEGFLLNFDNADIYEVIQVIAEILDLNYIIDPQVKGVVNIRSGKKVPRNQLFDVFKKILNINGLDIRREGDFEYVYVAKKLSSPLIYGPGQMGRLKASPRMVIQVAPVMHLSSSAAMKLVEPYLSDQGSIYDLTDHNTLLITDFESRVVDVLLILAQLDVSPLAAVNIRLVRVEQAPLFDVRDELVDILNALKINKKDFEGVSVLPLERANSLLLIGANDKQLDIAAKWVSQLDVVPSQGRDNIYFYNVRNSVASELADLVNSLISEGGGKAATASRAATGSQKTAGARGRPGQTAKPRTPKTSGSQSATLRFAGEPLLLADDSRNIILIRALLPDYSRLVKLLARLDNLPRQVLIEVMVAEVSLSDSWSLGIEWTLQEKSRLRNRGSKYDNFYITDFSQIGLDLDAPLTGFTYGVLNKTGDVVGLLNAVADDNEFSILSSPQVMVLNNETATVNVGEQVPVITTETLRSGTSDAVDRSIQYKDTGIILSVTPRINYNGIIILEIEQEVSTAEENITSGIDTPVISNRQLKTKLAVKDGQAILMGGLIEKKVDHSQSGIPLLKDIPLLGWLFKFQKQSTDTTELLVMITPYVIESEDVLDQYIGEFQKKMDSLRRKLNNGKKKKEKKNDAATGG